MITTKIPFNKPCLCGKDPDYSAKVRRNASFAGDGDELPAPPHWRGIGNTVSGTCPLLSGKFLALPLSA